MGGLPSPAAANAIAEAAGKPDPVAFVCVNVGPRYSMAYVEILRDMVLRNFTESDRDCAFFCLTDRLGELPDGVNAIPAHPDLPGWWQKLYLFSPDMPWAPGQRVVYFDLDVAITGRLEELVETPGIIKDFLWPGYNSSVMVWDHLDRREIWDVYRLQPEIVDRPSERLQGLLPAGQVNGGDQEVIWEVAEATGRPWKTFPFEWCRSYRDAHAWPPAGAKVVVMHGNPKPAEITDGWVPNIWKIGGYTAVPEFTGVNTSEDARLANVEASCKRDLEWFTGFGDEGKTCVIVGGAPSLQGCLGEIRDHKRRGARIVTVNNAWRALAKAGIASDANVVLDARPENAEFATDAPKAMRWLLASQCHPAMFDALEGHEVVLWHNGYGDNEAVRAVLAPYWEGPDQRPCILVPGGSTVGLRSLWLATFSGFRNIHMYGVDSSYADDGSHHAYPQALNDREAVIEVARGAKTYRCAPWMIRQASEFIETWNDLRAFCDPATGKPSPVTVHVHGYGLLPDIARGLRDEARAA